MTTKPTRWDAVVVGAGPAGLTAALYLARYRRSVLVLHDGESRALRIPLTHNAPGFPGGIRGEVLVRRMMRQAKTYGARIVQARVDHVEPTPDGFVAHAGPDTIIARTIILATGIRLNQIDLPDAEHEAALEAGCLRYCPICDGYEATGRRVGVVGGDSNGAGEALFLRRFTDRVTLMARTRMALSDAEREALAAADITVLEAPVERCEPRQNVMGVRLIDGSTLEVDILYPALGCQPRRKLAEQLALPLSDTNAILTDARQTTPVEGVFAAGDVVEALDQISVAIGHGAIAATNAHNYLRAADGETLPRSG